MLNFIPYTKKYINECPKKTLFIKSYRSIDVDEDEGIFSLVFRDLTDRDSQTLYIDYPDYNPSETTLEDVFLFAHDAIKKNTKGFGGAIPKFVNMILPDTKLIIEILGKEYTVELSEVLKI